MSGSVKHLLSTGLRAHDHRYGLAMSKANFTGISNCYYSVDKTRDPESTTNLISKQSWPLLRSVNVAKNILLLNSRKTFYTGEAIFQRQVDLFFGWYDHVTHTNEIRDAHRKVDDIQEKLNRAYTQRHEMNKDLNHLREKLQCCYADLAHYQRTDPKYMELLRQEIDLTMQINRKTEEFNLLEKEERDIFIQLQAAMKTSHEKEKIHTNSAKYWSIVGTLAGALLGICGTAFSMYNRNDLLADINKRFIDINNETKIIKSGLNSLQMEQTGLFDYFKTRDRQHLEEIARKSIARKANSKNNQLVANRSDESWAHWIGRKTYVISAYRYFVPNK